MYCKRSNLIKGLNFGALDCAHVMHSTGVAWFKCAATPGPPRGYAVKLNRTLIIFCSETGEGSAASQRHELGTCLYITLLVKCTVTATFSQRSGKVVRFVPRRFWQGGLESHQIWWQCCQVYNSGFKFGSQILWVSSTLKSRKEQFILTLSNNNLRVLGTCSDSNDGPTAVTSFQWSTLNSLRLVLHHETHWSPYFYGKIKKEQCMWVCGGLKF